ncbi:MAG TPA: YceI family protein [Streptosporangiaceae bacterium]|nr:YceI family protein [Streptosporangiaceae bacterium]
MAANGGRHRLGPDDGQLFLRTYRSGLAAQAGHDLTIEMPRWSADLDPGDGDDLSKASLEIRIDMGALVVREGRGGVKPLTDRDRREIAVTARKQIAADRYPEATFAAEKFEPDGRGGGAISGTLTLHGQSRPLRLQVSKTGDDRYRATASIVQSEFGIKPYSGMFGALKLRDAVDVEVEVALPEAGRGEDGPQ